MEIVDRQTTPPSIQQTLELSKDSREALQLAVEEAITHGRGYYIDTADLLLGLSQISTTGQRLAELGITVERIREAKEQLGGYDYFNRLHPPTPPRAIERWTQLPRTQRMHKIGRMITERAIEAKRELVEPEDILEVIVSEGQGIGARVLNQLGVDRKMLGGK